MGRVIAIANQKGGVGKTTTAINLGASLAAAERTTLLIDLDPQANATSGLGFERQPDRANIYHVLLEHRQLPEAVLKTELPCLHLVPSSADLLGAELELIARTAREQVLRTALASVRERFDYILIDCPPSLGLITVNALTAADSVLVPLQCEYYALEGISLIYRSVNLARTGLNPKLHIEGVLLTMYDRRTNLALQVEQQAREHFGDRVFQTVIPRNVRLSEAPSFGKPALLYDVASPGAQAYLRLAKEIIDNEAKRAWPRARGVAAASV